MEVGRNRPSELILRAIEEKWGISRQWLETGRGEMFVERRPNVEFKVVAAGRVTDKMMREMDDGYFPVPIVGGAAAAGSPRALDEDEVDGHVPSPYNSRWCPHPTQTVCLRIAGDSMEPTVPDGGLVAVDHAQRDPAALIGRMVAFRVDGGVTIKRLKFSPQGKWIGAPDNPNSQDVLVFEDDEIRDAVIGRVVWWWGSDPPDRPTPKK